MEPRARGSSLPVGYRLLIFLAMTDCYDFQKDVIPALLTFTRTFVTMVEYKLYFSWQPTVFCIFCGTLKMSSRGITDTSSSHELFGTYQTDSDELLILSFRFSAISFFFFFWQFYNFKFTIRYIRPCKIQGHWGSFVALGFFFLNTIFKEPLLLHLWFFLQLFVGI